MVELARVKGFLEQNGVDKVNCPRCSKSPAELDALMDDLGLAAALGRPDPDGPPMQVIVDEDVDDMHEDEGDDGMRDVGLSSDDEAGEDDGEDDDEAGEDDDVPLAHLAPDARPPDAKAGRQLLLFPVVPAKAGLAGPPARLQLPPAPDARHAIAGADPARARAVQYRQQLRLRLKAAAKPAAKAVAKAKANANPAVAKAKANGGPKAKAKARQQAKAKAGAKAKAKAGAQAKVGAPPAGRP